MKQKTAIWAVVVIVLLAGAWGAYNLISDKNQADTASQTGSPSEAETKTEAVPDTPSENMPEETGEAAAPETETAPEASEDGVPEGDAMVPADDAPEGDGQVVPENLPEGDAAADAPEGDAAVNTAADFTVLDAEGNEVTLSDLFGRPILINFWATWCPPCQAELPAFEAAYKEYGDEIVFMMVDLTDGVQETIEGVRAFAETYGYTFPVYYDTTYSASDAYGIYVIPMTVGIGRNGNVLFHQVSGMTDANVQAVVEMLLAE